MEELRLREPGPAQSNELVHFTGRIGAQPAWIPPEITKLDARQRLDAILGEERLRAFAPYGAPKRCLCFSESPPDHLAHLIRAGRFQPWGVVAHRGPILKLGGGAVAYVPDSVHASFATAGLQHWAVRTGGNSEWMHEREWRLPTETGERSVGSLAAILVGDDSWRPSPVETGWVDPTTGEETPGPEANPYAQPVMGLPRLWRETEIWVWDTAKRGVVKYAPGVLC